MKFKFIGFYLLVLLNSCSKSTEPLPTPANPIANSPKITIDYTTKYSSINAASLAKTFNIESTHAESIKVINLNNKYYLITSNAMLFGTTYDYFRSFEIDTSSGQLVENTTSMLGGYVEVGFPKSPFFYEDLNGDGVKDLFEVDHGKETPSLMINGQFPGFTNHLFLGTSDGKFKYATVADLTDIKRFHHNAGVGDMDGDGDNDLVLQYFGNEEMIYFKNAAGLKRDRLINPNNATGSVLISDVDGDGITDIVSAPYIDRFSTPNTFVLKINLTQKSFSSNKISTLLPFGKNYGCYKILALKNPKTPSNKNIFYFVEGGVGDQKIFRSSETDISKIEDISTLQSTYKSNGTRDFLILDLNFDGLEDIFFFVNSGETLNERVWLNKGDNTFENPNWSVDLALKDYFVPLTVNEGSGRIKFLYYENFAIPKTRVVDVYTKKR